MQDDKLTDAEIVEEDSSNRRRHPRSSFAYPVQFEFYSKKGEPTSFDGFLKDISLGGAGLEIDDQYGRFNIKEAENGKLRLTLSIPREDKIHVLAQVQWVKKIGSTSHIKMGIFFKDLDYKGSILIEKLIGLKSKDHNMMWNLWEKYCQ